MKSRINHFLGSIIIILIICGHTNCQPLEFYDVMDSARVKEVKVKSTSDGGWLNVSIARDSILQCTKYNYCGEIQYNRVFKVYRFLLSDLHINRQTLNNSDSIYISCTFNSPDSSGIFCLHFYPYNGDYQYPKIINLPNTSLYKNPKLIANAKDKILFFNAGNHPDSLTGHIIRMDNFLQVLANTKFENYQLVHDMIPLDDESYIVSLGDRIIGKLFRTLQFEYLYQLDSLYSHFDGNLAISNNNNVSLIGNYSKISNDPTLCLLHFDTKDKKISFSKNLIRYSPLLTPKLVYYFNQIESVDNNYAVSHLISIGSSNTFFATSLFNQNNYIHTNAFRTRESYTILTHDNDYLPLENNFVQSGAYSDTLRFFSSKLNRKGLFTNCFNLRIPNNNILDSFKLDTFNNLKFIPFPLPRTNSSISLDTFTISLKRVCKYFDFVIDTFPLVYCNGNIDTTFNISVSANDPLSLQNPFVKYLWKEDNTTERTNTIVYDKNKQSYPSKYVIISYCKEVDTTLFAPMPVACPPEIKFPNVFIPSDEQADNKLYGLVLSDLSKSRIKNINWSIFNRWGEKVFNSSSFNEEWNGEIKNTPAPADSYMISIEVFDIYGMPHSYSGIFTLVR
ncbi:MAG: hypothetical protein HOP11_09140 [Saprospiraceae bacterium]|nr:hypothetical protein [Saprospiraceae bacterium]